MVAAMRFLASAEATDLSGSELVKVVVCIGVVLCTCVLVVVPAGIARYKRHRRADAILTVALLWGLLIAASVIQTALAQLDWSKEWLLLVKTGYYDPMDTSGAPVWPWGMWGVLAAAYCALVIWALRGKGRG
jgi:hypothetical protein